MLKRYEIRREEQMQGVNIEWMMIPLAGSTNMEYENECEM